MRNLVPGVCRAFASDNEAGASDNQVVSFKQLVMRLGCRALAELHRADCEVQANQTQVHLPA